MPVLWIRDSGGRWHVTRLDGLSPWGHNGTGPWTDTRMVTLWLKIIPPSATDVANTSSHAIGAAPTESSLRSYAGSV